MLRHLAVGFITILSIQSVGAVPLLTNPDFSGGTTGWTTGGGVTTSSGGFLTGSYSILASPGGLSQASVETLLGLSAGALNFINAQPTSTFSVVFQDIAGSYTSGDSFNFDWGGLTDNSPQSPATAIPLVGIVDLTTNSIANSIGAPGVTIDNLGFPPGSGFDGFATSIGPQGSQPILIGTANPARIFALVASDAAGENSALAFSVEAPVNAVPEIDPGSATLPLALSLGIVTILLDRRRQGTLPAT